MVQVAGGGGPTRKVPTPQPGPKPLPPKAKPKTSATNRNEHQARKPASKSNSSNPQSPAAADRAAATAAAAPLVRTGSTKDKPNGPLRNNPVHPMAESTFRAGRDFHTLKRAFMRRRSDTAADTSQTIQPYEFHFLYNPETVSISNSVYTGIVPPDVRNTNDPLQARFPGQETISFALMLDRGVEAWHQGGATRGTLPDIEQLYRVINGNEINFGYLTLSAVQVFWSAEPGAQSRTWSPWSGFVTSLNITHTKFNPRMVPIRSVVDLTLSRLVAAGELARGNAGVTETARAEHAKASG